MKYVDRLLQNWRIRKALRNLPAKQRVVDVGAHEGELFRAIGTELKAGFGIEPLLKTQVKAASYSLNAGYFPAVLPGENEWDAVTMLAVLEHVPRKEQPTLADACYALLKPGGRIIITVPSKLVDHLLSILRFLRLIDGMSLEEHFGFEPAETPRIFAGPRFKLVRHERFQLGLNHLYVFEKEPNQLLPHNALTGSASNLESPARRH